MTDFNIEAILVTMQHWTMVDFHINTIFVTMRHLAMVEHDKPCLIV